MKELNKYSTELIRELIIPQLTKEVNRAKRYAGLRQVYYSLILARWFKQSYQNSGASEHQGIRAPVNENNALIKLIDSGNLSNLISQEPWSKDTYYQGYKKSFEQGEYNLSQTVHTPTGQLIRRYVSGGTEFTSSALTVTNHYNAVSVEKIPFGANVKLLNYTSGGNPAAIATASPLTLDEAKDVIIDIISGIEFDNTYSLAYKEKSYPEHIKAGKDFEALYNELDSLLQNEKNVKKDTKEELMRVQNSLKAGIFGDELKKQGVTADGIKTNLFEHFKYPDSYYKTSIDFEHKNLRLYLLIDVFPVNTKSGGYEIRINGNGVYVQINVPRNGGAKVETISESISNLHIDNLKELAVAIRKGLGISGAISSLTVDNKMSKLLEGWEIFKSIEMLALNQTEVSFKTNILIGKKVYTIIKASKQSRGDEYWTIELLGNAESKAPAVQIRVYEDGRISAMALKALSDNTERDLIVAKVIRHFSLDKSQMAELEKKGVSSALTPKERMTEELNKDIVLNEEKLERKIGMGRSIDLSNKALKKSLGRIIHEGILANGRVVSRVFVSTTDLGGGSYFELIAVPTKGIDPSNKYRIFLWNDVHGVILDFYIGKKISVLDASEIYIKFHTDDDWHVLGMHIKDALGISGASSALVTKGAAPEDIGAVDFRAMDMLIQPQGSFRGLDFSPARLSSSALEAMDLDKSLEGIKQMVSGSMRPAPQRLKEYVSACIFKGKIDEKADDFILSMLDVFQLQAEEGIESAAQEREAVVLADTRRYVLPEKRLAASNGYGLN